MQATYQTRLELSDANLRWLGLYGRFYGEVQRTLYSRIASGQNALKIKKAFCAEFDLASRQYNAIRIELDGKIGSTAELLKLRKDQLVVNISRTIKSIEKVEDDTSGEVKSSALGRYLAKNSKKPTKKLAKDIQASSRKKNPLSKEKIKQKRLVMFGKERRLESLVIKLKKVDARLASPVPGICFGSRKLFRQQFHLDKTNFGTGEVGHANWKTAWSDSRSHQFFSVGSKDETSGNSSCKALLRHAPPTTEIPAEPGLALLVKMPPALVKRKDAPAFIMLENIDFSYGHEKIVDALRDGVALSYRFHRDDNSSHGWRVFVSTDVKDAKKVSLDKQFGLLGIDFNADHLAWSRTDRFGNIKDFGRISFSLNGKSSEQREALLSDALIDAFAIAQKHSIGVAIEDLDFSKKKSELKGLGVKRARMLSGLAYAKFRALAMSKASRLGIELHFVNPAFTSVAGSVKYASRLGCTVHQAASGVISRRAQGYSERLPRAGTHRVPLMGNTADLDLPARNRSEKPRTSWWKIGGCLTRHCAEQVRILRGSSANRGSSARKDVSKHQFNGGGSSSSLREPGELLARRTIEFQDVPF